MNKTFWTALLLLILTPGLATRGQTAYETQRADTLHFTPKMLDSLRREAPPAEFDRKLESVDFIPKGQWIVGLSLGYSQSNQDNYQFLVLESLSGDTYNLQISPKLLYAFHKDMAIGVKFSYQRGLTKLKSASIVAGEGTNFDINHLYSIGHNYYGTILYRNYFSLGRSKRFGFFSELQCQLGGGQSKLTRGSGNSLTGSYERNFSVDVGLVPGLVAFINNFSAVEVNIGVLGFSYRDTKTISDQIYVARRKSQYANFHINLFSINFGAAFYL